MKNLFTLLSSFGFLAFAQDVILPAPSGGDTANSTIANATAIGPNMNKVDFAYAGAPLIVGDSCDYKFHEEFNTLLVTCFDSEGMISGQQMRVIQAPIKQCSEVSDQYMPLLTIDSLGKLFAKEAGSNYICCDFFEAGFGYLFTNCGGDQVVILKDKVQGEQSQ